MKKTLKLVTAGTWLQRSQENMMTQASLCFPFLHSVPNLFLWALLHLNVLKKKEKVLIRQSLPWAGSRHEKCYCMLHFPRHSCGIKSKFKFPCGLANFLYLLAWLWWMCVSPDKRPAKCRMIWNLENCKQEPHLSIISKSFRQQVVGKLSSVQSWGFRNYWNYTLATIIPIFKGMCTCYSALLRCSWVSSFYEFCFTHMHHVPHRAETTSFTYPSLRFGCDQPHLESSIPKLLVN